MMAEINSVEDSAKGMLAESSVRLQAYRDEVLSTSTVRKPDASEDDGRSESKHK